MEETNVKQSAVKARSGDAMDVCWYCDKKGHRAQRDNDSGKSKGSKKGDSKGKSNKEKFKSRCYKCGKTGHMSKDCRSKKKSAFEAGDELAQTRCIEMASVDLNALEIEAVQLREKGHRIRVGIDSCAAVTVFPKSVADDYPMLDMPGKAKRYRPASSKLLPDLGARKVQVKLRDGSLRHVNPRVADTHRALMNDIEERHIMFVFFTFCSGTDQGHDGQGYDCGPPKLTRACNAASPTKEALLQPLVSVGGSSGSRDVIYPIPGGGLLGERPAVPGGRERIEREEQLQRQIEGDAARAGCEG